VDDIPGMLAANAEHLAYLLLAQFPFCAESSDSPYIVRRQFSIWLTVISCVQFGGASHRVGIAAKGAPFQRHVLLIVLNGAEPEMSGIHATRIVATGAIVKNPEAIGDRTMSQGPCDTMSQVGTVINLETTVSESCGVCLPQPAVAALIDLLPETFGYRPLRVGPFGRLISHGSSPFHATAGAVPTVPGHAIPMLDYTLSGRQFV
jgi:hypothetical protein